MKRTSLPVSATESTSCSGAPRAHTGDVLTTPRTASWARTRAAWAALSEWATTAGDGTFLSAMVALALALRLPRLGIAYWGDEAISVGIATRPLGQIPAYLRFDGSPPLYYVVLHFWTAVWGTSPVATHTLSLLVSLAAVPVAWWCAKALFGPRAARPAALLAAVSPYLAYYGTETRMYVIVAVTSMLAVTAFVRALRAPPPARGAERIAGSRWRRWREDPAARWLVLAVGAALATLYTHNWGIFLAAALVSAGVLMALKHRDRTAWRRTLTFSLAVAAGYAPWMPSFLWQLQHTGAPWAPRPGILSLVLNPLDATFSATITVVETVGVATGAGGRLAPVWLSMWILAVTTAVAAFARHWRGRPSRRGRVEAPAGGTGNEPLKLASSIVVLIVLVAWTASQLVHAWASRYLGVAVAPLLLVLAGVAAANRFARMLLPALAAVMCLSAVPVLIDPPGAVSTKSNVSVVDASLRPELSPGDLVISTAPSELPVIAYYLPNGLRYATAMGAVSDPHVVDWVNLTGRLAGADPRATLERILHTVPLGGRVLLVNPLSWATTQTPARYAGTVAAEGIAVNQEVLTDPHLTVVRTIRPASPGAVANPVEGILLVKTG